MPTLLANENIPRPAVLLLRAQGVSVDSVQELMPGADDATVLAFARTHGHWLVTFDRDYGELVFARGAASPQAIIYLRQEPAPPAQTADIVLSILRRADEFEGYFVIASERSIRRRRLPVAT